MQRMHVLTLLALSVCTSGCVIVRPQADTILSFQPSSQEQEVLTLGFRETNWSDIDGKLVIVGQGWHPREHETYMFIQNEGYPVFQPRWILITSLNNSTKCMIDFWYAAAKHHVASRYVGELDLVRPKADEKCELKIEDVVLTSVDSDEQLTVSGKIVAKPASEECVQEKMKQRLSEVNKKMR